MKKYGFLLSLLLPTLPLVALFGGRAVGQPEWFAWLPMLVAFVLLPIVDAMVGVDTENPDADESRMLAGDAYYRYLTLAVVPLQIMSLTVCGYAVVTGEGGLLGQIGYLMSCGAISGSTGITTAHELIHKSSRLDQWAGGFLLATVCYASFKPEHLYGHHRHVATPKDGSTARFGETVYAFILRALRHNPPRGYRIAAERVKMRGYSAWSWRNEMVWWTAISASCAVIAGLAGGALGVFFFVWQSLGAIILLEIINYVEHYGLMRELGANGRYERISPRHSWNANHRITNLFLFQLQRHSDHHANGSRPYQSLRHFEESPQLPFGYATATVTALLPPLWFSIMNPRVLAHQQSSEPQTI